MPTLSLTSPRLLLRPLQPEDAEYVFQYRSHPEVARYQNWDQTSAEAISTFIAKQQLLAPNAPGTWYQLGICLRDSGQLIGDCGMHFPAGKAHEAEFGITLAVEHQGKGYAQETLNVLFAYLFETLGKHRITSSIDPRNLSSLHLMERCGMRKEAHFRESLWFKGEWVDDIIYALLRREWQERRFDGDRTKNQKGQPG